MYKPITFFFKGVYNIFVPTPMKIEKGTPFVKNKIESIEPCLIARFGSVELQSLCYIKFFPFLFPFKKRTYYNSQYNSGFFPVTLKNLRHFYKLYKEDVKELDVMMSWRFEEMFFKSWIKDLPRIDKWTLDYCFTQDEPWTQTLQGKKVLVISPFANTIKSQYENKRESLFTNPKVLPEFKELHVIKAVQSIAGTPVDFENWFDALDWMKNEMNLINFDIALIGCGAYSFPLAAHAKRMGKTAIHMGGAVQFLFGIKGLRYLEIPTHAKYINDYFVFPDNDDCPKNASLVEGGCYWG
jgi:hypothetical protein